MKDHQDSVQLTRICAKGSNKMFERNRDFVTWSVRGIHYLSSEVACLTLAFGEDVPYIAQCS